MTSKKQDFKYLIKGGYPFGPVVAFFMHTSKTSLADVARSVDVDRSMVAKVITGQRKSKPVKQAVSKALGFDPWDAKI